MRFRPSPFAPLAILAAMTLASCASLPLRDRGFDPKLCDKSSAYEAGFNDGQEGLGMGSSFLDNCREDLRAQGQEGYRTGYEKGRVEYAKRLEELRHFRASERPAPALPAGATDPTMAVRPGPKAWFCSVETFGKTYESFGPTQLQARQLAMQDCLRVHHAMHCQEITCQVNR